MKRSSSTASLEEDTTHKQKIESFYRKKTGVEIVEPELGKKWKFQTFRWKDQGAQQEKATNDSNWEKDAF